MIYIRTMASRITPSSESVWTTSMSATSGVGTWGPTITPALAEALEQDGHDRRHGEDDGQRLEELMLVVHSGS